MNFVRLGPMALVFALATSACTGPLGGDADSTESDLALRQLKESDLDVEGGVGFGETKSGATIDKKVWAVSFHGAKGDKIKADVWSTATGTAYLFKKTGAHSFATIRQQAYAGPGPNSTRSAILEVTLATEGDFFIGFAQKGNDYSPVRIALDGTPASADAAWLQALKHQYEEDSSTGSDSYGAVSESELPAAAKSLLHRWTHEYEDFPAEASLWTFQGRKVYVIQESNDGGMMIAFFDEQGHEVAGGSCSESGEFQWD